MSDDVLGVTCWYYGTSVPTLAAPTLIILSVFILTVALTFIVDDYTSKTLLDPIFTWTFPLLDVFNYISLLIPRLTVEFVSGLYIPPQSSKE